MKEARNQDLVTGAVLYHQESRAVLKVVDDCRSVELGDGDTVRSVQVLSHDPAYSTIILGNDSYSKLYTRANGYSTVRSRLLEGLQLLSKPVLGPSVKVKFNPSSKEYEYLIPTSIDPATIKAGDTCIVNVETSDGYGGPKLVTVTSVNASATVNATKYIVNVVRQAQGDIMSKWRAAVSFDELVHGTVVRVKGKDGKVREGVINTEVYLYDDGLRPYNHYSDGRRGVGHVNVSPEFYDCGYLADTEVQVQGDE